MGPPPVVGDPLHPVVVDLVLAPEVVEDAVADPHLHPLHLLLEGVELHLLLRKEAVLLRLQLGRKGSKLDVLVAVAVLVRVLFVDSGGRVPEAKTSWVADVPVEGCLFDLAP